jgi:hypothetical protein
MVEFEEMELKGGGEHAYLLKTLLTLDSNETPEEAFEQLVEAIRGWIDMRGADCGGLGVAIIAPGDKQQTLIAYLISLVQKEEDLRDFFKQIGSVSVMVGKSQEEELSQFTIKVDGADDNQNG